jgi:uncharacterized protein YkwD
MKTLFLLCFLFFLANCKFLERRLASLDLETLRNQMLTRHNGYRAQHQVGNLVRNSAVEAIAQAYSEKLAASGSFQHSGNTFNGNSLGENLFMTYGTTVDGNSPVDMWYDEVKLYDFNNQGFSMDTGHFTQLVWKGSKNLGCGIACGKGCYVTCNYYPAGNYLGMFESNVFPKK